MTEAVWLPTLRRQRGIGETEMTRRLHMLSEDFVVVEHLGEISLSDLDRYLGVLGGTLELTARFPGRDPIRIAPPVESRSTPTIRVDLDEPDAETRSKHLRALRAELEAIPPNDFDARRAATFYRLEQLKSAAGREIERERRELEAGLELADAVLAMRD